MRQWRAERLILLVHNYNNACFRCPNQRILGNSIKVGVSPDATLAYIDILFDDIEFSTKAKPLCNIEQVKLPAAFKVAGLGTYSTPFYMDTNDMLLQAVPQTDVASFFIDENWIAFIVELNKLLRTMAYDSIQVDLLRLIDFLDAVNKNENILGGLIVELCMFPNRISNVVETVSNHRNSNDREKTPDLNTNDQNDINNTFDLEPDRESRESFDRRSINNEWYFNINLGNVLTYTTFTKKNNENENVDNRNTTGERFSNGSDDSNDSNDSNNQEDENQIDFNIEKNEKTTDNVKPEPSGYFSKLWLYVATNIQDSFRRIKLKILIFLNIKTKSDEVEDIYFRDAKFSNMCSAFRSGDLAIGIKISHPKVSESNYIVTDTDYLSADDNFLEDEEDDFFDEFGNDDDDDDFDLLPNSITAINNKALDQKYGEKKKEMKKFHNMVLTAEKNINFVRSEEKVQNKIDSSKQGFFNRNILDYKSNPSRRSSKLNYWNDDDNESIKRRHHSIESNQSMFNQDMDDIYIVGSAQRESFDHNNSAFRMRFANMLKSNNSPLRNKVVSISNPARRSQHSFSGKLRTSDSVLGKDSKSIQIVKKQKRVGSKTRSDLKKLNLAPSSFQEVVNAWRRGPDMGIPVSDGMLQIGHFFYIKYEKHSSNSNIVDESELLALHTSSLSPADISSLEKSISPSLKRRDGKLVRKDSRIPSMSLSSPIDKNNTTSNDAIDISYENPAFKRRDTKLVWKTRSKSQTSSTLSARDVRNVHKSSSFKFSKRFFDFSVDERLTEASRDSIQKSSIKRKFSNFFFQTWSRENKKSNEPNYSNERKESIIKEDRVVESSSNSSRSITFEIVKQQIGIIYVYIKEYVIKYIVFLVFGRNINPYGPHYVYIILGTVLPILCFLDLISAFVVLLDVFCISDNVTACTEHNVFYIILLVWPLALLIAPLQGIGKLFLKYINI